MPAIFKENLNSNARKMRSDRLFDGIARSWKIKDLWSLIL